MLTDTHCHLWEERFGGEEEAVVERAIREGVKKMIVPGANLTSSKRAIELAKKYPKYVRAAVGIHPEEAKKDGDWLLGISELIENNRQWVAAVGEIGVDAVWGKEDQKEIFRRQLQLAGEMGLPVVVHNREAEEEIRAVMEPLDRLPAGQFHCWSGSDEMLDYVLSHGFYVGFCGNVTYPKNDKLREQAARVPRERLLLETDSPYLPPQGKRGERNEPANVKITAQLLADLRGVSLKVLAKQTSENAARLFKL